MTTPGTKGSGTIQSHTYEASNVNMTEEMAKLIQIQRGFQLTSRVFQQTDTMINEAIHLRKA
jgi:flagellar basal body rod protein FlgG